MSDANLIVISNDQVYGAYSPCFNLIICKKTGVIYNGYQTGGNRCNAHRAEGFIIDISDFGKLINFDDCNMGCMNSYSPGKPDKNDPKRIAHSAAIEECLSKYTNCFIKKIKFDYERILELEEAWWPVIIEIKQGIFEGYIVGPNCD